MPVLTKNAALPTPIARANDYQFRLLAHAKDCLTFPADVDYRKLARAAHMYAARRGFKVAVRRLADGGIGVWRLD